MQERDQMRRSLERLVKEARKLVPTKRATELPHISEAAAELMADMARSPAERRERWQTELEYRVFASRLARQAVEVLRAVGPACTDYADELAEYVEYKLVPTYPAELNRVELVLRLHRAINELDYSLYEGVGY